ncbi:MAG: DUF5652 family protein [Candidatus Parcubacteria bacterium]|nr:DUF5652 family protein [Candidatus Parcubacteria bacterium]
MDQFPLGNFGSIWLVLIILLVVWSIIWKGLALWKAARNGHAAWFVVMMIFNTVGILEIIYILAFSKPKKETI